MRPQRLLQTRRNAVRNRIALSNRREEHYGSHQTGTFQRATEGRTENWGRFGPNDEIGALNFLTSAEVLRGIRAVKQGKVFTLGVPVARPGGDPLYPSRSQPIRTNAMDKGLYIAARRSRSRAGWNTPTT